MVQPVYCPRCGAMPIRGGFQWHIENNCSDKWNNVATHEDVKRVSDGIYKTTRRLAILWSIICTAVAMAIVLSALASAADALPAVSPPTDWTGVVVVSVIGALIVAIVGYIINIKRTAGLQFGEAEFERIANLLHAKMNPPAVTFTLPTPLVYDGITFADVEKMIEYKAAKEIIETYKGKS